MGAGAGIAGALPTDPPGGATPVYPAFNNGIVNAIRDTGSDTTFYMMQKIGDLYTSAGLYGCQLNTGSEASLYNSGFTSSASNASYYCQKNGNLSTTDTIDNWDRTEVYQGVDNVGSGAGQSQLCAPSTSPLPVDFSRSSKPAGSACSDLKEVGYAKDSVPAFQYDIAPGDFGTVASTSPYATINGNGSGIGPVASGWLPGDPADGPYSGTPYTSMSNIDNGGGAGSTAYRLWCATDSTRISDWGQLTNLGPSVVLPDVSLSTSSTTATLSQPLVATVSGASLTDLTNSGFGSSITASGTAGSTTLTLSADSPVNATHDQLSLNIGTTEPVGSGGKIGVPVRIVGVNPNSGTESTWASYAESGVSGGGCAANTNTNAASDPNSTTATGDNAGQHIALENNASQIGDFAVADFPGDVPSQAVEESTSLYYESNGVYTTNPYSGQITVGGTGGTPYSGTKMALNGTSSLTAYPTTNAVLNNIYPTSRTLFNIYRTGTVKASTAGFLNWLCDSNTYIQKEKDNSTGVNFDTELSTIIGSFGFIRLTDTQAVATHSNTPADNVSGGGINTTCASALNGGGTAGNGQPPVTAIANALG
jgi:hypothetical protein